MAHQGSDLRNLVDIQRLRSSYPMNALDPGKGTSDTSLLWWKSLLSWLSQKEFWSYTSLSWLSLIIISSIKSRYS